MRFSGKKQKANKLGVEGDPTAWNAYLITQGKDNVITDDVTFKNFKTQISFLNVSWFCC